MNKKNISNIIYTSIIVVSLFAIVLYFIPIKNKSQIYEISDSETEDPITEVLFDNRAINVGSLSQDTVIFQDYVFKNIGEHPLIVYYVFPDCNCTGYNISSKFTNPGDSIVVTLKIDTKDKGRGAFMLNTALRANTPEQLHHLSLFGNIVGSR